VAVGSKRRRYFVAEAWLDPFGGLALLRVDAGRPPVGVIDRVIDRVPDSGLLLMEVGLEREEPEASTGHHWGTFGARVPLQSINFQKKTHFLLP
jgi:hypothetical protein